MRYVIIRDDDTNALTPPECLETLYRPLLDRGLVINLATIPAVSEDACMADGSPEGFLLKRINGRRHAAQVPAFVPIGQDYAHTLKLQNSGAPSERGDRVALADNPSLISYLKSNPGFRIVQHGCHHDYLKFDTPDASEIRLRLDVGARLLQQAGFSAPETFVAPYDKLSRAALREVSKRFRVISTGWFELKRVPYAWWPGYVIKKLRRRSHWRAGRTILLSHPGCLLSCHRSHSTMLTTILHYLQNQHLTVLVTHWWEYFRNGVPDQNLIKLLHETGSYIATHPDLKAISFSDLASGGIRLN